MSGKGAGGLTNTLTGWVLLSTDVAMREVFGPTGGHHGL